MSAPPSRAPPAKPPPLPPKPSHLADAAPGQLPRAPPGLPPSLPPRPRALAPRAEKPAPTGVQQQSAAPASPPEHCLACGLVFAFGSAATTEKKTGEPSIVDSMESVAAFQVAVGDTHGAILAGGKRAGLYMWRSDGADGVARPSVETVTFANTRLQHVACGGDLTAVVTEEGQLFLWAQRGSSVPDVIPREPTPYATAPAALRLGKVACGEGHVLAISADCLSLVSWGANDYGQLGLGPTAGGFNDQPRIVSPDSLHHRALLHVAAGRRHSAVVSEDGQLYTFGSNLVGQCGVPLRSDCLRSPHHHAHPFGGAEVRGVACGHYHTLVFSRSGDAMLACGLNKHGQLGLGSLDNADALMPVEKAQALHNIVAIGAGESHSVAVTSSLIIFAWGKGSKGQVGTAGLKKDVLTPKALVQVPLGARCVGFKGVACSTQSTFVLTVDDHLTRDNELLFPAYALPWSPAPALSVLSATWCYTHTHTHTDTYVYTYMLRPN